MSIDKSLNKNLTYYRFKELNGSKKLQLSGLRLFHSGTAALLNY